MQQGILTALRLAAALKWCELERLSPSKAAELGGVSRQEFLEALNSFQVSPFQVTPEELAGEVKQVSHLSQGLRFKTDFVAE